MVLDCSGAALKLYSNQMSNRLPSNQITRNFSQLLNREVSKDLDELKLFFPEPLFDGIGWIIRITRCRWCFAKHWDTFYKVDIPKIKWSIQLALATQLLQGISSALSHREDDASLLKRQMFSACSMPKKK